MSMRILQFRRTAAAMLVAVLTATGCGASSLGALSSPSPIVAQLPTPPVEPDPPPEVCVPLDIDAEPASKPAVHRSQRDS